MSVKKMNEELTPQVLPKLKKYPIKKEEPWKKGLTVGKLKKMLATYHNDVPIVMPGLDHSYEYVTVSESSALFSGAEITEDYGEDSTPEAKYGKRLKVIVIG